MKATMMAMLAASCLAGCGFHLKGALPQDHLPVAAWRVQGEVIDAELQRELVRAQGQIAPDADAEIRVLHADAKRDIYTITRAAKLNEYLYSLRVVAQAYRAGKAWGEPMQIDVRRTMSYSDSSVLGKETEENLLWQEIRQDAAAQVVRRLGFLPKE